MSRSRSTVCTDRSFGSLCSIALVVPAAEAVHIGFEAQMQTAKINQVNEALKLEFIANDDSRVVCMVGKPIKLKKLSPLIFSWVHVAKK